MDNEKEVLKALKGNYQDALAEINSRIELLMARQDADMQHVIYQVEYQKALKGQVEGILKQLQSNEFETVSDYLAKSYEDGFIGTMYDLQGQGIPLVFPIDQEQVVEAIQHETKLSESLYTTMGKDMATLKKQISSEISRGISNGAMISEIARNIKGYARIPQNNAMRIARTEAHRIQCKAASNAQHKAKEKGADVVKQWDSTLDGKTRDTHRELDGQIRELDEPFEVAGMKVMEPGGFGIASEDINCRCALLQRARWALNVPVTKWSPDAPVEISDDGTTQFFKIEAKDYDSFKKQYYSATERVRSNVQKMKMAAASNDTVWDAKGNPITKDQYKDLMKYAREKGIELSGFKQYDGDIETIKKLIDNACSVAESYPEILSGRKKLTVMLDELMDDADFAKTDNHIVHINANAFRNAEKLEQQYQKQVAERWFVQGTNSNAIIFHEIGHVVANTYGLDVMAIAQEITGFESEAQVIVHVESILSEYSGAFNDGREIIAECFASVYNSTVENEFALRFVEKCGKIITNP